MRITNNVLVNNLRRNLYTNLHNMEKYQMQLATGRRINKPSDDPTGLVDSMRIRTRLNENVQYQANIDDATAWLNTTDEALGSLTNIMNRVYELTVASANGTNTPEDREIHAMEVKQLIEEAKNIANTSFGDKHLFGGNNTTEKPFDKETGQWNANDKPLIYEIGAGIEFTINTTAKEVFQYDDPDKDLLKTLQGVYDHMANDAGKELAEQDILKLKENMDQVLASRAKIGARVNRLEMTSNRMKDQEINYTKLQAEVEGADPAEVIMQLKTQENVYRSALSVGARIIQPTLMDFLR